MTARDRKALLYFAGHVHGRERRWRWRLWWRAIDLLPYPNEIGGSMMRQWAAIAESMAYEGRR